MALSDTTANPLQECRGCGDLSSVSVEGFCSVHCFDVAFSQAIRAGWVNGVPECAYCGAHFGEFHKSDRQPGNVVGSGHRPKPPIGLKPRSIHDAQRVEEIVEAMGRYAVCGKPFPAEWIRELSDISKEQAK